jgi:hypothetical protein
LGRLSSGGDVGLSLPQSVSAEGEEESYSVRNAIEKRGNDGGTYQARLLEIKRDGPCSFSVPESLALSSRYRLDSEANRLIQYTIILFYLISRDKPKLPRLTLPRKEPD